MSYHKWWVPGVCLKRRPLPRLGTDMGPQRYDDSYGVGFSSHETNGFVSGPVLLDPQNAFKSQATWRGLVGSGDIID